MKQVININFQGRVIPIEESAYDILKQYVESLRRYFANEEGRDEIINDIEGRIAELFGETLKKGATCITDENVEAIIASMGRPEDFEGEEASVKSQLGAEEKQSSNTGSQQQSYNAYTEQGTKRLYRDENNKVLGGVASGMANYFNVDPLIVRILFVIFFGVMFIPYLILWVAIPGSSSVVIGSQRKRLFRDPDDKVIAGVCSGLSQYFGVSIWIPRLLFILPFLSIVFRWGHWGWWDVSHFVSLSFSPAAIFIYFIFWLVLPEAKTSADRLEMKGEKVDLNTIKNTIQNDMEGFGKRAQKFGEEIGERAKQFGENISEKGKQFGENVSEKGKQFSADAGQAARRGGRGFGDALLLIIKIFAYFIVGCILFSIMCALFALGVTLTGLIPAWSYVVGDGWQSVLMWGTLIFFVWVPVLGIVTFIIRRLTKSRGSSNVVRWGFSALWVVGWFCFIGLLASLSNDFHSRNIPVEEQVALNNPSVKKLRVKLQPGGNYYHNNFFRLEPFSSFDGDTVFVKNIHVQLVQSADSNFHVKMAKLSNGRNRQQANELAAKIQFDVEQNDSILSLSRGIAIDRDNKFRNQHVVITIAVPKGKMIYVDDNAAWDDDLRIELGSNDWNWWNTGDGERILTGWHANRWYVMGETKLQRLPGQETDDSDRWNDDDNDEDKGKNKLDRYEKSREELQKDYEETQKKADELKKALQKPVIDSSSKKSEEPRYRYQPQKPKEEDTKATAKPVASADMPLRITDLLMMRIAF